MKRYAITYVVHADIVAENILGARTAAQELLNLRGAREWHERYYVEQPLLEGACTDIGPWEDEEQEP